MTAYQWGTRAGVTPSLETRARISRSLLGNTNGAAKRGYTPTPEARAKQRDAITVWHRKRREAEGTPERWQEIASMWRDGMTLKDIGDEFGITLQRVAQILQKIARRDR